MIVIVQYSYKSQKIHGENVAKTRFYMGPPVGWEHLSWDIVIVCYLVYISMVTVDKMTDS